MRVRQLYNDERSKYQPTSRSIVINWGSSKAPFSLTVPGMRVLNRPEQTAIASDKLQSFRTLKEAGNISIPEFTESKDEAAKWIEEGAVVVARTQLRAHSGEGIVVCSRVEDLPNCRLFTRYIKKKKEFRAHVVGGRVVDIQQKKQRSDFDGEVNYAVRNHANGWIYAREDIEAPADLEQNAVLAVNALGLDFGAVDIVYNEKQNKCFVLEVNTAPGIEGTTVQKYADAFMELTNGTTN